MSFELVRQLQEKAVAVEQMCRVLEVSRAGYDAARRHGRVQPVVCEASVQLKAAFAASGRALQLAIVQRQAAAGLIVHWDRGSHYASAVHQALLTRHGLVGSMSRKGN